MRSDQELNNRVNLLAWGWLYVETSTFYLGLGIGCCLQKDKVDLTTLFPERWRFMTWLRNKRALNLGKTTTQKTRHPSVIYWVPYEKAVITLNGMRNKVVVGTRHNVSRLVWSHAVRLVYYTQKASLHAFSPEKFYWWKEVEPSPERKMIKALSFDTFFPPLRRSR